MMSDSDSNNSDTGRFKASKSTATHRTAEASRHDSATEKRRQRSRSRDYDRRRDERRRSRSRERRKSPSHYSGGRHEERRFRPEPTTQKRHDDRNGASTTQHHAKSASGRERDGSDKRDDRHRYRGEERREEKKPGKLETRASAHSASLGPLLAEKTHAVEKLQSGENTDITATPSSSSSSESGEPPSFGPALPPSLQAKNVKNDETDDDAIKAAFCGPALPPHLKKSVEPSDTADKCYGPQMPTHLAIERPQPVAVIGPALPPNLLDLQSASNDPDTSSSDDEMIVGPMPESSNYVNYELEERALELKLGRLNQTGDTSKNTEGGREEWMLELPDIKNVTDLGLGARQFRTKERPDFSNRSEWTDTPDTKGTKHTEKTEQNRQLELEREAQRAAIAKRDAEFDKQAKKLRKKHKRDKSLMELHQKKLDKEKKRKEKEDKAKGLGTERRRFDRDLDLQVNRFDEAQKKCVIKKAQLLDTRFAAGAGKYL